MTTNGYYSTLYALFIRTKCKELVGFGTGNILSISIISRLVDDPDAVNKIPDNSGDMEVTGKDRLRFMFKSDEYGNMSPELTIVTQGTLLALFTGSIIGGTNKSRESYLNFMQQNQATAFTNHIVAKRKLQDMVTLGFIKGAWRLGWRLSIFTGTFLMLSTTISVYRGKSSVLEYFAAGSISGLMYKFKQGPKAMFAGSILGGGLGTIAGSLSVGLMYFTGTSFDDIRHWQQSQILKTENKALLTIREARVKDLDELEKFHTAIVKVSDHQDSNNTSVITTKENNQTNPVKIETNYKPSPVTNENNNQSSPITTETKINVKI